MLSFPKFGLGLTSVTSAVLLAGQMAYAQADKNVALVSPDGSIRLEGTMIEVTPTDYVISTINGNLTVRKELVICEGEGCPDSGKEISKVIILSSPDGSIRLQGDLIELTETDYVIGTMTGDLTVRRELVGCEGEACPSQTEVVLLDEMAIAAPSDVGLNIIKTVVERYADDKNLNVTSSASGGDSINLFVGNDSGVEVARVNANALNAQDAVKSVVDGQNSFALVRGRATPAMLTKITGRNVNAVEDVLLERTIALDAISFVVNPNNPLDTLSIDDVRGVMSGKTTSWSELGGPTGDITIHSLPLNAELMEQLQDKMFGPAGSNIAGNIVFHDTTDELLTALKADPFGFAAVYRSRQGDLVPLELESSCRIYYGSSDFSVQTQEYPFTVGWYLYAPKTESPSDFGANLVSFLQTNDGQDALSSQGLLSQSLRLQSMKDQGNRVLTGMLANNFGNAGRAVVGSYLDQIANSKRVSTTLRFRSGSASPDNKAFEDIDRISGIIRSPEYANYTIKLVGFSDTVGDFNANIGLSSTRAAAIQKLLLADNPGWLNTQRVQVIGAGPVAPVECNDTDNGRRLNRRVEVWLSPPSRK